MANTLGIDIGGTSVKAALICNGEISGELIEETTISDYIGLTQQIDRLVQQLGSDLPLGIGIPGLIDYEKQIVLFCPKFPFLNGKHADEIYSGAKIGNDVDMALLGETKNDSSLSENILMVCLGTGVGSSFCIDGKYAWEIGTLNGELGHMKVIPNGKDCDCGGSGCLGAYAGGQAMLQRAKKEINENINSVEEIFTMAGNGDANAAEIINSAMYYLGIGIANVIELIGAEKIIIGGQIANSYDAFIGKLENYTRENLFAGSTRNLEFMQSQMISQAAVMGAGAFAEEK